MRMERLVVTMRHSTAKAFRRYAQIHDVDLYMVAKMAVTEYCRMTPSPQELMGGANDDEHNRERVFISMPDTAMRLLELWSLVTGITKAKLMEWAVKQLVNEQNKEEETIE